MVSTVLLRYVFLAALRDRLLLFTFFLIVLAASLSIMLGGAAVMESDRFALVIMAASLRLAAVFVVALFVCFYIRRSFDSRDVDFILTRPVSRLCYLASHALAFSLLAVVLGGLVTGVLFGVFFQGFHDGYLLWSAGFIAELVIMSNAALFFSMVLPNAVGGVLASAGLYVLARLMGDIFGVMDHGGGAPGFVMMKPMMEAVSLIVPRLDLLAQTSWLVYPSVNVGGIGFAFIFVQGTVYSCLLVAASMVDFLRRQF